MGEKDRFRIERVYHISHNGTQVLEQDKIKTHEFFETRIDRDLERYLPAWRKNILATPKAGSSPATAGTKLKTSVKTAGRVLKLRATGLNQSGGGIRGEVSSIWSKQSRNRLVERAEAIDWDSLGRLLFVTLTYRDMPESGEESKRHLKNFRERWKRRFGTPVGMWKLEFQRRGVPHYHLILQAPKGSLSEIREWVATSWFEVVGSNDEKHLQAGTEVDYWRSFRTPGGYFAKYGTAKGKEYQNQAPEDFRQGRWWGTWGDLKPQWKELELSHEEFWKLRRIARGLSASRGRKRRNSRAYEGIWIVGDSLEQAIDFVRLE